MTDSATVQQVIERLESAQSVLVIGHGNPDGDAISSVAGLVSSVLASARELL